MTFSTGSGGESRRTGRGQCGQAAGGVERADAADAALGHVAFDRAEPVEAARAEPGGEPVDQQGEIGRGARAGQLALDRLRAERLDADGDEAHPLDAEAGLDRLDLRRTAGVADAAPSRVARAVPIARSARLAVDALADEDEAADGEAGLARAGARAGAPPRPALPRSPRRWRSARGSGAGSTGGSSGTIGSNGSAARPSAWSSRVEQGRAEAALERARAASRSARRSVSRPSRRAAPSTSSSSRSAASGSGASASASPPGGQRMSALAAEAGERMRGAGRAGDGDAGGEAEPARRKRGCAAHPLLAAEQMGDAGQIEPEAVRRRRRRRAASSGGRRTGRAGPARRRRPPDRRRARRGRGRASAPGSAPCRARGRARAPRGQAAAIRSRLPMRWAVTSGAFGRAQAPRSAPPRPAPSARRGANGRA